MFLKEYSNLNRFSTFYRKDFDICEKKNQKTEKKTRKETKQKTKKTKKTKKQANKKKTPNNGWNQYYFLKYTIPWCV